MILNDLINEAITCGCSIQQDKIFKHVYYGNYPILINFVGTSMLKIYSIVNNELVFYTYPLKIENHQFNISKDLYKNFILRNIIVIKKFLQEQKLSSIQLDFI